MSWRYEYAPYIWPMLGVAAFAVLLAIYSFRHRSVPGARPFCLLATFSVPVAIAAALEHAAVDIPTKIAWAEFQAVWKLPTVTAGL